MQVWIFGLNLLYAACGVVLMYLSFRAIDKLLHEVDLPTELQRGNVAAAIFVAGLWLSIALIVGHAIG